MRVPQEALAAPSPYGGHGTRALYSVDSTEPMVEDVGEGKLASGHGDIKLDPNFAAIADAGAYQVFLTGHGDLGALYITDRTPTGFKVHSPTGASGGFAYRVMAKRKGAAGRRLEKVEAPRKLTPKDLEPAAPPPPTRGGPLAPGQRDDR